MTFLQAVRQAKTKYHTDNQVVIFTILFKLSKHVKNTLQFTNLRNQPIDFNFQTFCKQLCDYFAKQKPLSQIVGYTKFCHLRIDVFKNIFEPRSETELITEDIIKYLNKHKKMRLGVDLCCGSGCMGITVKKHCPQTNIICVDINPKAILNTKHNAKLNNVKIKTIIGDFYQTLIDKKLKVDFIICNPPYVDKKDLN
jgi:release factor glutamine methyltransferase